MFILNTWLGKLHFLWDGGWPTTEIAIALTNHLWYFPLNFTEYTIWPQKESKIIDGRKLLIPLMMYQIFFSPLCEASEIIRPPFWPKKWKCPQYPFDTYFVYIMITCLCLWASFKNICAKSFLYSCNSILLISNICCLSLIWMCILTIKQ